MLAREAAGQARAVGAVRIRRDLIVLGRLLGFDFADRNRQAASVVAVIALRVDRKDDLVARSDLILLIKCNSLLRGEVADRAEPLLFDAVDKDPHAGAVRRAVIAVGKLDVRALDLDLAVLGDDPLVGRIPAPARLDKVSLELRLAVVVVSGVVFVVSKLGEVLAVPVAHAVIPAVVAVLAREAAGQARVIGAVRIRLDFVVLVRFALFADRDCQTARVISVIAVWRDLERDDVVGLNLNILKIKRLDVVVAVALKGFDGLFKELLVILADRQDDAVREVRVAVVVPELRVVAPDINCAVLLDNPLVERALARARVDKVFLHLQPAVRRRQIS